MVDIANPILGPGIITNYGGIRRTAESDRGRKTSPTTMDQTGSELPTSCHGGVRAKLNRNTAVRRCRVKAGQMKILIADDHELFREGLRQLLRQLADGALVLEAANYTELLALLGEHPDADLAIMDLNMPGHDTELRLESLFAAHPTVPTVVLSASEYSSDMQRALDAGAMGYLPKSTPADVLLCALRLVLSGGIYVPPALVTNGGGRRADGGLGGMTPRQREVLERLVLGRSNKEIGRELGMSEATVKVHLTAIFRALNVTNRVQAVHRVKERQLFGTH
jgi:DNA-binding NarL/FixJ family response regulator